MIWWGKAGLEFAVNDANLGAHWAKAKIHKEVQEPPRNSGNQLCLRSFEGSILTTESGPNSRGRFDGLFQADLLSESSPTPPPQELWSYKTSCPSFPFSEVPFSPGLSPAFTSEVNTPISILPFCLPLSTGSTFTGVCCLPLCFPR